MLVIYSIGLIITSFLSVYLAYRIMYNLLEDTFDLTNTDSSISPPYLKDED